MALAGLAFILMVCAETLRIAHGKSVDYFHVLFGIGMLAFIIAIAKPGSDNG